MLWGASQLAPAHPAKAAPATPKAAPQMLLLLVGINFFPFPRGIQTPLPSGPRTTVSPVLCTEARLLMEGIGVLCCLAFQMMGVRV